MKLAHLADLHLGFRQFDRQTPRGANQREADVAQAFSRAVDDLLEQRPDLVVIAGDVFHSVRPTNPAILFLFQQLQRIRVALPETPVVLLAGDHDTPRTSETGSILKLYEAVGAEIVLDTPRRLVFPKLDCAVLAVPHQALMSPDRPALRPERGGPTFNILLTHFQYQPLGEARGTMEYGGALLGPEDLAPAQWDYVALGHFHVAHEVIPNAWYAGSLEYLPLLHFECCYYQAIEFAIARRIPVFEGGAQGEHKLFRGLMPVETLSAHWLAHPKFARAVETFLEREGAGIARYVNELVEHSPFKETS